MSITKYFKSAVQAPNNQLTPAQAGPAQNQNTIFGHNMPQLPPGYPPHPFYADRLTYEEQEELTTLSKEHAQKIKEVKINEFKKLPGYFRQNVINEYKMHMFRRNMQNLEQLVPKSARHIQLEQRESKITYSNDYFNYSGLVNTELGQIVAFFVDGNITLEDLHCANTDISAEEELLTKKP